MAAGVCCLQECTTDTFTHAHFMLSRPAGWPPHTPTPPIPSTAHTFKLAFALCFVEQTHTGSQGTPARSGLVSGSGMWTASRNHTLPSLPSHPFADFPLFHSQSAENVNKRFLWKVVFFDTNDEAAASWQISERRRGGREGHRVKMWEGRSSFGLGAGPSSGSVQIRFKGQRCQDSAQGLGQ